MLNNWKPKTHRDEEYLAYIRTLPCVVCGKIPCQAHHLSCGGKALKCNDLETAPLCPEHHSELTNNGKKTFIEKYGIDWKTIRLNCLVGYIGKDRPEIEDVRII